MVDSIEPVQRFSISLTMDGKIADPTSVEGREHRLQFMEPDCTDLLIGELLPPAIRGCVFRQVDEMIPPYKLGIDVCCGLNDACVGVPIIRDV